MKKNTLIIGGLAIIVLGLILSFVSTSAGAAIKTALVPKNPIAGTWVEQDTSVEIAFTKDGKFQMVGSDIANYTVDAKTNTIDIKYGESYGGREVTMSYTLVESTDDGATPTMLTLINESDGGANTYKKVAE